MALLIPGVGLVDADTTLLIPGSGLVNVETVESVALPAQASATINGLAPTLDQTLDQTRGHARRRRAARRARIVEQQSSGPVQAIVLPPDVPAYFDPPTDRLAGFNTLADALEVRLTEIEHKRAAIARRRREEEEIVRFLLRVA